MRILTGHKQPIKILVISVLLLAFSAAPVRAACNATYLVEPGDSLARIAERCGTTIAALKEANKLSSHILQVGQALTIPEGTVVVEASKPAAPIVQQNIYTVQDGDSWARIAQRNGISVEALQQANEALDSLVLQPGQQLVLPAGAGESESTTPTVTPTPAPVVPAVARDLRLQTTLRGMAAKSGIRG